MREFVTHCDWHWKHERVKVPAQTYEIAMHGEESRLVDYCGECHDRFVKPLDESLAELSRPASGEEEKHVCPHCPRRFSRRASLNHHVEKRHPERFDEYSGKVAPAKPGRYEEQTCTVEVDGKPCGQVAKGVQGLAAHKRIHGIAGKSKATLARRKQAERAAS